MLGGLLPSSSSRVDDDDDDGGVVCSVFSSSFDSILRCTVKGRATAVVPTRRALSVVFESGKRISKWKAGKRIGEKCLTRGLDAHAVEAIPRTGWILLLTTKCV